MALLSIIVAPDPRLKAKAELVECVDAGIAHLMEDMLETMYAAPGVGLAAPQVGVLKRVIVIDTAVDDTQPHPLCMANPEITELSDTLAPYEEGCLSLPEYYELVERPSWVTVRYLDHNNQHQTLRADGLLAVVIQHEIDHLDGKLFVDHVSSLKRGIILRKLTKSKKTGMLEPEYTPSPNEKKT